MAMPDPNNIPKTSPGEGFGVFLDSFLRDRGLSPSGAEFRFIPGDGSKRRFWRVVLSGEEAEFIAMENPPIDDFSRKENRAYLLIGRHLFEKGLPLPEIYQVDLAAGWFVMEYLGEKSLQAAASDRQKRPELYCRVLETLLRMQVEGSLGFDICWTCQTPRYDREVMSRYEAEYFRDAFLGRYLGLKGDWPELGGPFRYLAERASGAGCEFFLHRDFQSRNLMVLETRIGVIDWQGGRLGPLGYDLASLLIDPYVGLDPAERDLLYRYYLDLLKDHDPEWVGPFEEHFPYLAIQRNLQILGAFSFLSRVRGKTYFEAYIPPALVSLEGLLLELGDPGLSPLLDVVRSIRVPKRDGKAPPERRAS